MKMTVTNVKPHGVILFSSLSIGEVFIGCVDDDKGDTDILIRIEQNDCDGWNCVSLTDGTGYIFPPNEEIKLIEAELVYSEI